MCLDCMAICNKCMMCSRNDYYYMDEKNKIHENVDEIESNRDRDTNKLICTWRDHLFCNKCVVKLCGECFNKSMGLKENTEIQGASLAVIESSYDPDVEDNNRYFSSDLCPFCIKLLLHQSIKLRIKTIN